VLDEADRLLEDGFADELGRVLGLLPRRRRQWLFSATFGPQVLTLARDLLEDPVQIGVVPRQDEPAAPPTTTTATAPATRPPALSGAVPRTPPGEPAATLPATLVQRAIQVDTARRTALLRHLLHTEGWSRLLVFAATRYATEHVAAKLNAAGVRAAALHGELSQGARTGALADFRSGAVRVLVATDMASRGLHLEGLPAVLNYDLARSPATHIHRVGRTARQGSAGVAVSFIAVDDPAQEAHFRLIEKRQGQRVEREQVPGFEPVAPQAHSEPDPTRTAADDLPRKGLDPHGGLKGRRKSRKDKLREAATPPQRHTGTAP
jgi:superfamily II DNA/RNA helicase